MDVWIHSLSAFLGCPLRRIEGSEVVQADDTGEWAEHETLE